MPHNPCPRLDGGEPDIAHGKPRALPDLTSFPIRAQETNSQQRSEDDRQALRSSVAANDIQVALLNSSARLDMERVRRDFSMLGTKIIGRPLVYLGNVASTQKSRSVLVTCPRTMILLICPWLRRVSRFRRTDEGCSRIKPLDRRFHRSDQAKTTQGSCQEPAHGCVHHPGWDDMTACELPIIHVIVDAG